MGAKNLEAGCILVYEDGSERSVTAVEAVETIDRKGVQPFVAISARTREPIMRSGAISMELAQKLAQWGTRAPGIGGSFSTGGLR
mgnify:CR=1 FL=1